MGEQEPIGKTYRVERVVSFERVYLVTAHSYREADDRVEREIAAVPGENNDGDGRRRVGGALHGHHYK